MAREEPHVEDLVDNQRPLDAEGFPQVNFFLENICQILFQLAEFRSPFFKNPGFSEVTIMSIVDYEYADRDIKYTKQT